MEKKVYERENGKHIERVILIIYSAYTLIMTVMSSLLEWGKWVPQIILGGLLLCIFVHIQKLKTYRFRALFTTLLAWMNFVIYGINSESLFSILSTQVCIVILIGIYCIPETVYIAVGASTFLIFYHGFILKTIHITPDGEGAKLILQMISVYVGEYITYYLVKTQVGSNKRLLATIDMLKKTEQSKDDFMANISHEIRTPINTISGMSEMVLRENLPNKVREDIFDIQAAGRNLLSIVSDILDFSELESGNVELVEEPYNITSTINDIMNMAIAKKNEKNLELIVDCDAGIPSGLLGDEQKIHRAIMNVVDNAIKFTAFGGVLIVVSARKEEYGVNLFVSVKDTGIGMSEENLERLFTSFNQVDTKRNRQEGGIGLGLAIAQAIVNKMGGFISVKSAVGKGSEVQIVIPQKVADSQPIISVDHAESVRVAAYINMEKYDYALIRDGYANSIGHMVEQLGIGYRHCRNLAELKRRVEKEKYTHVFISWEEYCEDKVYFEELSEHMKVILVRDRENEESAGTRMLHIYKPFYVLSVASVLNGENVIQSMDGSYYQNRRFIAPEASVLVVDDNIMNLRVVEGLLRPYKIKVFVAGSGKEALQKVESMEFDFIFMDHMMPEMDGVETFHRIRQKPGRYFKNVPIIALTANAIGGAREMFLEEGFSDFVAKPIEISVLERVLRRHIPEEKILKIEETDWEDETAEEEQDPQENREEQSGQAQMQETGSTKPSGVSKRKTEKAGRFVMEGINAELGIFYSGGDVRDYIEIVQIYYKSGLKKLEDIQRAYTEKDWKTYAILVHSVKSMSMGIGAVKLSDMAKELEAASKAVQEEYIFEHTAEMLEEYKRVLGVIAENKEFFPNGAGEGQKRQETQEAGSGMHQSEAETGQEAGSNVRQADTGGQAQKPEIMKDALIEKLDLLAEKLQTFEYDSIKEVFLELSDYRYGEMDLEELLNPLREKADMFDFMGAEEELVIMREKIWGDARC